MKIKYLSHILLHSQIYLFVDCGSLSLHITFFEYKSIFRLLWGAAATMRSSIRKIPILNVNEVNSFLKWGTFIFVFAVLKLNILLPFTSAIYFLFFYWIQEWKDFYCIWEKDHCFSVSTNVLGYYFSQPWALSWCMQVFLWSLIISLFFCMKKHCMISHSKLVFFFSITMVHDFSMEI